MGCLVNACPVKEQHRAVSLSFSMGPSGNVLSNARGYVFPHMSSHSSNQGNYKRMHKQGQRIWNTVGKSQQEASCRLLTEKSTVQVRG